MRAANARASSAVAWKDACKKSAMKIKMRHDSSAKRPKMYEFYTKHERTTFSLYIQHKKCRNMLAQRQRYLGHCGGMLKAVCQSERNGWVYWFARNRSQLAG